jgi:hypothetical protein
MAIGIYFPARGLSAEKYDELTAALTAAGLANPPGRRYHIAFGTAAGLHVFDVWESQEQFDEFGDVFIPLLAELGVDVGRPIAAPVHNAVQG